MSGNAMLTMKRSRLATNVATETRVRTCQRRCISQGPYIDTGKMQADEVLCRHAVPELRRSELLDSPRARGARGALDAADPARGPAGASPLRGDPPQHGCRDEHPHGPAGDARRARSPAA